MEKKEITISFVDKGDFIEVRQNTPNMTLNSRDVIVQLAELKKVITNAVMQVEMWKSQIKDAEVSIETNKGRQKDLQKYEARMTAIQESKAKAIYEEIKKDCIKQVNEEYHFDKAMDEKWNNMQKYSLLQRKVATNPRANEELAPEIIRKCYFIESCISNPWI